MVFRPLAGCGLFRPRSATGSMPSRFPSPCGVWVVSSGPIVAKMESWFPSPCGVWVVSEMADYPTAVLEFPSPCGVWVVSIGGCMTKLSILVSVPLRGVGCFQQNRSDEKWANGFRPLAGCGSFLMKAYKAFDRNMFPSPCGVWVVSRKHRKIYQHTTFPSPCGVWVVSNKNERMKRKMKVSVPLRGVGCFGKAAHSFWCNRKKNCQLCYFIVSYWQMFINSKLRNCKVPCEAHKTAT